MTQLDRPAAGEASAADGRAASIARGRRTPDEEALEQRVVQGIWGRAWKKLRKDRLSMMAATGLAIVVFITVLGPIFADLVLHTSPESIQRMPDGRVAVLQPPSSRFLLGTDDLGRDVLTRLLYAGRVSLSIGFLVAGISVAVGTAAGLAAAYYGGWVDDIVNACIQFIFNIPGLFLLIILSVIFQPDVVMLSLIFAFFFWPGTARQVRGVAQSVRTREYVVAAQSLGGSDLRLMSRHILPNISNVILVGAGFDVQAAILGESALSYLGFGVRVPLSSWGNMLTGSTDMFEKAPWLVYPPGAMIFITVLCVVLLADGLRDALDPGV